MSKANEIVNNDWFSPVWDGDEYKIGKWTVGKIFWTAFISKGDTRKYQANCLLPGIKSDLGKYEKPEEAKSRVEQAVKHWRIHSENDKASRD